MTVKQPKDDAPAAEWLAYSAQLMPQEAEANAKQTLKDGWLPLPVVLGMLARALGLDNPHSERSRGRLEVAVSDAVRTGDLKVRSKALGLPVGPSKADIADNDTTVNVYDVLRWYGESASQPIASLQFRGLDVVYSLSDLPTHSSTRARARGSAQPSTGATVSVAPARLRIQQEATEEWIRWLARGGNPTVHSVSYVLATWCAKNDVKTVGKVNPRAGTIRNTILGAGHWTPPDLSREKAKAHVARLAQVAQVQDAQVAQGRD